MTLQNKHKTYHSFLVEVFCNIDGFRRVGFKGGKRDSLECPRIAALPSGVRGVLCEGTGLYRVQRVKKTTEGAIPLSLAPASSNSNDYPVEYAGGNCYLCEHLCALLGYSAKRPQTMYVSISPVQE